MNFSTIPDFAVEKNELEFTGFLDWFVAYNNVHILWKAQPSYLLMQLLILIGSLITFCHAWKTRGQFIYLWIGIILHGLVIESISYNLPDIDNFWHSQSPIIFLGRRLPLYIILIYTVFIYPAVTAINRLKLPIWSQPFAVGLVTVLIDYPYDIVGIRLMHWTWHDTDPNISDKHYYVPWNSFYFHAAFTTSFIFWFNFTRFIMFGKFQNSNLSISFLKEFMCTIIAALLGMPGGVILFIPLYHPLHDIYGIHTEVTVFVLFVIFLSIIWLSCPNNMESFIKSRSKTADYIILIYMFCYYTFFVVIIIFIDPASEISIGWHEPIGSCHENLTIHTALGHILYKRKYLCLTDNDESYFGWSCLPNQKPPTDGAKWYTICGTPFTNRIEYIVILSTIALLGCSFFLKALYCKNISTKVNNYHKPSVKNTKKFKSY